MVAEFYDDKMTVEEVTCCYM